MLLRLGPQLTAGGNEQDRQRQEPERVDGIAAERCPGFSAPEVPSTR
jgi:hypothetical protein